MKMMTYAEGIREGMSIRMRENPNVVLFGEDVGAFGGCFGVSAGMIDEFGPDRVRDTPISEGAIVDQAECILRSGGIDYLKSGYMGNPGFERLGMLRRGTGTRAGGHTQYHGHRDLAAEHITHLRRLIDQLVHADGQKVAEHQLGDGPQSRKSSLKKA